MELTYSKCGDYYIPDLALSDTSEYRIGRYDRMRERFLKEHHSGTYTHMLLSETLWKHLAEIGEFCRERMDNIIPAMEAKEGMTEALKASNQMEWVGRINSIRSRAEEIVLYDLIYTL
ncbi:MAG: TnpV protein [Hungatella sp.]